MKFKARLARMSLHRRLVLSGVLMLALAMPAAGYLLVHSARVSVTSAFDARLDSHLQMVIASLGSDELGLLSMNESLADPAFSRIYSGWYWQVQDADEVLFSSRSLWDAQLPLDPYRQQGTDEIMGPQEGKLRVVYQTVRRGEHPQPLQISVAATVDEIETELDRFEVLVSVSLAVFAAGLMLLLAMQIQWSLRPLRWLSRRVQRLQGGEALTGGKPLPAELDELAVAIEQAFKRNEQLLEHSRATAGNLAHALKTPLAVLRTHYDSGQLDAGTLGDELQRIEQAIQHHLARASVAGRYQWQPRCCISEVVKPVIQGITLLARRQNKSLRTTVDDQAELAVDPQDLQEIAGNLLENAVQHARSQIQLTITEQYIQVEDDGSGLAANEYDMVLQRGRRLDQREGNGLGLAIVQDLVNVYGYQMTLSQSRLGGLSVCVRFYPQSE